MSRKSAYQWYRPWRDGGVQTLASRGPGGSRCRRADVLRRAQDCDPGDPFAVGLRRTYAELEAERNSGLERIARLGAADEAAGEVPSAEDVALLDALP